jgi:formate hydrogenlyase subunit 3/multisubunit Na+/H+ antiporter MnhD subunit
VHQYYAAFLVLEGLMIGVFCALDALLFYVFFEAMLIPMFIIIGIWGGPRRVYATIKFFLYTFLGSIFMLIGLIYLYLKSGSFDAGHAGRVPADHRTDAWLFFAFLLGVRGQGADVPGAHLAAGCARRGADRRFGDPGRDHAEDRRLTASPLRPADHARCRRTNTPGW